MAQLSAREIAHYRAEGWVVPQFALAPQRVAQLQDALDQLLRDNPGVRPEKLVSAHIEGDNGEGVRGSRHFLELAQDPELVELVSDVIGNDVILWGCHVFCKPAHEGYETPWHQDGHYWPIRPLANCTVWVAIEPSTVDNGCLRVIPRSHRNRELHAHLYEDRTDLTLNQRMADGTFDAAQAHDIELQPGQMSLHDVYMIHGARPNTSARRRTGVALRYMPATSVFDRSLRPVQGQSGVAVNFAQRPLWLLKGVDRSGCNDFEIGHRRAQTPVDDLFSMLYADLCRLARREVRSSGAAGLLGTKTLVHEAWLNVEGRPALAFTDARQFLAYASRTMRGLVIDRVRAQSAQKRGGDLSITSLDTHNAEQIAQPELLQSIGDALEELATLEPDLAHVVDLKFFCGFSLVEVATMQGVSERTVQRQWEKARALLIRSLKTS